MRKIIICAILTVQSPYEDVPCTEKSNVGKVVQFHRVLLREFSRFQFSAAKNALTLLMHYNSSSRRCVVAGRIIAARGWY